MASIEEVIKDPDFLKLSGPDQVAILEHLELKPQKTRLVQEPQPRSGWQSFQDIPETQPEARHAGAMPFVNRAIARNVGAPADLLAAGVNRLPGVTDKIQDPFLGRKSIERGMESIGINLPAEGQRAETIPEHMGQVVGETSTYLLPMTKTMQGLAKGAGTTARVSKTIYDSMVKHPYLTMASEASGAAAAGVGRGASTKSFPDSPAAQTSIEIGAGVAGSMVPSLAANSTVMLAIRTGKNLYRRMLVPFSKKGGKFRAGGHVKKLVSDPKNVVLNDTISDLPPSVASGQQKIIELYKGLSGLDPVSNAEAIKRTTNNILKLNTELEKLGYRSPELLSEITEMRIAAIELGMDKRIIDATELAQKRLDKIPKASRKAAEGRIVGEELRKVMTEARVENQRLWNNVDKDLEVKTESARKTYEILKDQLGQAQKVDIPATLKGNKIITGKKVKGQKELDYGSTVREMQSLRSKLLETARSARKDGQWNKARIAGDMADAIMDDLDIAAGGAAEVVQNPAIRLSDGTVVEGSYADGGHISIVNQIDENPKWKTLYDEGGAVDGGTTDKGMFVEKPLDMDFSEFKEQRFGGANDLREAIASTKQFKLRFESGETGRILGYSKSGAPKIDPDLTLESTVGRFGEKGAIDIEKIVQTPVAKEATERYLGRSFTDYAAPDGTLSPTKAQRWIKNNEAILDEYPGLKDLLSDASGAQEFANRTRTSMDARKAKLRNPKISVSARYLNKADLGQEISDIFKQRNSSKIANELVKQANKDASGEALEGLKAGFLEYMFDKSKGGAFNELGERVTSGRALLRFIKENEPTLRMVFDNNQIKRLRRVGNDYAKLEQLRDAKGTTTINMEDLPSKILEMAGRLGGARLGGELGSGSMGGSLQYAGIFSSRGKALMQRLTHDKAKQYVQDAILSEDPKMLQALLEPMSKPKPTKGDLILLNKQFNAWLLSTGERVMDRE